MAASASVSESRVFGAAEGHFMSMYAMQNASQDRAWRCAIIAAGRPVSVSNAWPSRAACRSSERKLSAWAFVVRVRDRGLWPTFHRTSYVRRALALPGPDRPELDVVGLHAAALVSRS